MIFEDLKKTVPEISRIYNISESEIPLERQNIQNKNVLIIDDSIDTGKSVKNIINELKVLEPNKITVLNVVVRKSTLDKLEKEYPTIEFRSYKTIEDDLFFKYYSEHMFGYLDYITKSLDKDHFIITLKTNKPLSKNDLLECFNNDLFEAYDVERIIERKSEYKISVECLKFFSNIERKHLKNIKEMEMVKVRFYVDSSGTYSALDIIPILVPIGIPIQQCKEDKRFCLVKRVERRKIPEKAKDRLCLLCVQYYLPVEFIEKFITYLKEQLAQRSIFIISEERKVPSPMEFFRWWEKGT
ncbi:MAG: phosphoribosyltransferase [Methanobacteriota archaeon]